MASIAIRTILAGDETGVPGDSPFERLDVGNEYSFVGALSMQLGARTSSATGVALSPEWVLTAAHNVDFNDDEAISSAEAESLRAIVPVMKRQRKQFANSSGLQQFLKNLS